MQESILYLMACQCILVCFDSPTRSSELTPHRAQLESATSSIQYIEHLILGTSGSILYRKGICTDICQYKLMSSFTHQDVYKSYRNRGYVPSSLIILYSNLMYSSMNDISIYLSYETYDVILVL
jgi:hypothetical protein